MRERLLVRLLTFSVAVGVTCSAQSPGPGMPVSEAARILEQATWGPTGESIKTLQAKGFEEWYREQLSAPISLYPNQPMLGADGKPFGDISGVQVQFFQKALRDPDQLRQRVAFALSEIWVVSRLGGVNRAAYFPPLLNIFEKDAFTTYPQLMKDVSLNPAMGVYLDMLNNRKATATSAPNENYARELMQLFTMGLNNLNADGSLVLDANQNPVPIYTQSTVTSMARVMTGWTYAATAPGGTPPNVFEPMRAEEQYHDTGEKSLTFTYPDGEIVTTTLPGDQSAETDLDEALGVIFQHPSVAPFLSKQLIQHLVTSNPSPEYISRISMVFSETGGNLGSVVKAILTDREARDEQVVAEGGSFGHLREPVLLMENLLRAFNGSVADTSKVAGSAAALGQSLLQEPSVFSYFSPQYDVANGLAGPEFQLHTTQTAVTRANQINKILYTGELDPDTKFDLSEFVAAAAKGQLIALINERFFHNTMSDSVRQAMETALAGQTVPLARARVALYIALTSSEFQVIH